MYYNRLVEFAETNEIFYLCRFGFRKNHSTSHALIHGHLLNTISSAIDQHETTVAIFLKRSIPSIIIAQNSIVFRDIFLQCKI